MSVSIAMATYNGCQYIVKQLNSLLNQTRVVDEVIIVDDCSSDNTTNLILSYIHEHKLNHWKLYINKENIGYKRNFKKALELTTSDYIFLCDQDDIWEKDKVEVLENIMINNPDIKCLNTSYSLIDENDELLPSNTLIYGLEDDELIQVDSYDIFIKNISMGCTCVLTKEIKDIYLKNTQSLASHDWEINAIAALVDGLYYYNHPLIWYRIHSNNTTGLDVGKRNDKVNARKKNAIQIDNYLTALFKYQRYMSNEELEYLKVLETFSRDRLLLLNGGSKKLWFHLIKQYNLYKHYVSIKGMLIELFI